MKILIDIGGSGVKIKRCENGVLDPDVYSFKPTSRTEFYSCIMEFYDDVSCISEKGGDSSMPDIYGIAVSICGEYDYGKEEVLSCWHYPFLKGKLRDDLEKEFDCWNVHVVNDGDAHALALKAEYVRDGFACPTSAVNLSLGTAVGFGLLDCRGDLLHTCQGHNWEIGNWQCDTRENTKDLYSALGSPGLSNLEKQHGSHNAYIHYGQRLCHFLGRDLVPLFRPKIIGLSGGIVAGHYQEIEEGIRRECEKSHYRESGNPLEGVVIHLSHEKDSVMLGLAELLEGNAMKTLFRRIGRFFANRKSTEKDATSTSDWFSDGTFPDAGVVPPSIMYDIRRHENEEWSRCASDDELVAAISGECGEISDARLKDLITADEADSRSPHAWRALCWRHGKALARRLVFEKPLCECKRWEVKVPENRPCAIVGVHTGKVVCAENGGNSPLVANRRICLGAWEVFVVLKNNDGSFSMKSSANGKYVSANPNRGGILISQGSKVDAWERFDIRDVPGKPGVFRIWSHITQRYVSVDESASNILIANRDNADTWEEFRFFNEPAS